MLELQDYPRLYQASDSLAIQAQKNHFLLVKIKIVLLLFTAGIASLAWYNLPDIRTWACIVLAIFLVVLMAFSAILDMKKFDQTWFYCRAIAESVKKESWFFMMKAEPYNYNITDTLVEERFLSCLKEILDRQKSISSKLTSPLQQGTEITDHMRQIRKKDVEGRKAYYIQNRVRIQKDWYYDKANLSQKQESRWFAITWMLQIFAIIAALIIINIKDLIINPVGILTTAGASVLTWSNVRRYQELSQSYGFIAQELSLLETQVEQASTEQQLINIVLNVETAISREHAIWLVRRTS